MNELLMAHVVPSIDTQHRNMDFKCFWAKVAGRLGWGLWGLAFMVVCHLVQKNTSDQRFNAMHLWQVAISVGLASGNGGKFEILSFDQQMALPPIGTQH